jgi:hypothetical protein
MEMMKEIAEFHHTGFFWTGRKLSPLKKENMPFCVCISVRGLCFDLPVGPP